jgi:PTH1 family peptidyl-tRNA hydrolase
MFFVIGLGNPESRYEGTRHNLGFEVVDAVAEGLKLTFRAGRGDYLIARGDHRGREFGLIKPLTYMNESGIALLEIRERFDAPLDRLLVVCDDFQLPLGRLRLRASGSDGGHNGLYSIIYHLQSEDFPRLRCGIAAASMPNDKTHMAEYVLSPFTSDEQPVARSMVGRAKEACMIVVADGIHRAMSQINRKDFT